MNVVLMPSSYPPNIGGVEEVTHGLARQLKRRGHDVLVITSRWPAGLSETENLDGVPVVRMDFVMPGRNARAFVRFLAQSAALTRRLAEHLQQFRADIANVHCLGPNALYARWAARRAGVPLVASTHGEFQGDDTRASQSAFSRWVQRTCVENASCLTACSAFTLGRVPYKCRGPAVVVPNAVDLPEDRSNGATTKQRYLLCASRLTYNKGVDVLLAAFALARLDPDVELWIAGDGDQRRHLERQAQALGLQDTWRFLGALSRGDVKTLMQDCLFYVSPSRQEGFGLSNLEAMAAGKAVVAANVGGVPEVVLAGETGILVPPEDPDALAQGMRALTADGPLRQRLGAAGRKRAELFSWEAVTGRYLEVYGSVCA